MTDWLTDYRRNYTVACACMLFDIELFAVIQEYLLDRLFQNNVQRWGLSITTNV